MGVLTAAGTRAWREERGARAVACGVPCRVMRAITPADRDRYPFHESIAAKYGK